MSKQLQMRKALRFIPILLIFVAFGASTAHADNILYSVTITTFCGPDVCYPMELETPYAVFPTGWGESTPLIFDIAGGEYIMSAPGGASPDNVYSWTLWSVYHDRGSALELANVFHNILSFSRESYYIPPPPNADLVDNAVEGGAVIFTPVPEISSAVPEPSSLYLALLGMGLLGLMSVRKRISLIDNSR